MRFNSWGLSILAVLFPVCAFAFPPTFYVGEGMFIAKADCAGMNIRTGDSIYSVTEYTHFQIAKFAVPPETKDTILFNYSVPDEGAYVFKGEAGLQQADEFMTNSWSGSDLFDFKGDDQTGDLVITHSGPSAVTPRCVLTNNTGG